MNLKTPFALVSFAALFMSCTNDNSTTLMDTTPMIGLTTYNQNVKSIIDNNCIVCHASTPRNGASTSLVTYNQVKDAVINGGLVNRISLENGSSSLMPKGGPRLPQATIDIILKWQQDGLLENN